MKYKRWELLEKIKASILTIRKGATVGTGSWDVSSTETYSLTVGHVGYGYADVTAFSGDELPAVLIVPDTSSVFEANSDGMSSAGQLFVALHLIVRDAGKASIRYSAILQRIEELFRNVDLALHRELNLTETADVGIFLQSFDAGPVADSEFGQGVAVYRVEYQHLSF